MEPWQLTASEALAAISAGDLSREALVQSCLDRIAERSTTIGAWAHVEAEKALNAARRPAGATAAGLLGGIPCGFKDNMATKDMPTAYNSPLYAGHQPGVDADCVALVRRAGGIVLGKTTTVEFAAGDGIPDTRNPHDRTRSPGGSSSGSAAAVADCQVPVAFGTQTGGSIIRPAAFCGVHALKPTFGLVSCDGARPVSPNLDTVGWFARSVDDLRLVAHAFKLRARPSVLDQPLRLGLCRTSLWSEADADARAHVEDVAANLADRGVELVDLELPEDFNQLNDDVRFLSNQDIAVIHLADNLAFGARQCRKIATSVEADPIPLIDLQIAAIDRMARCRETFGRLLSEAKLDGVLTLASPGQAPAYGTGTGSAMFNTIWTALHVPCIALPGGRGANGLPLSIQLVGTRYDDYKLLDMASKVEELCS